MISSLIDRCVAAVSPEKALQRQVARQLLERGYDGANKGRLNNHWRASNRSADLEMLGDADVIRARSRDLVRNNAHAQGVIRAQVRNVIGCGIKPQARVTSATGAEREKLNEAIEDGWKRWQKVADVTGRLPFYEIQRLVYSEVKEAGECLIRFVRSPDRSRPVSLALELIEADRLATDEMFYRGRNRGNGNEVRRGVEIDATGVPVAYHIYKRNPNDVYNYQTTPERVPARQCLHLYQMKRIGQTRGISDFAPIVQWIRDLDQYMSTEMKAALVASCFSVAIKTVSAGADGGIEGLTQTSDEDADNGAAFDHLLPGLVSRLFPDEDVSIINPSRGHTDSAVWVTLMQRAMAVGAGLSYERLTRDYSNTNFSSNRASDLEDRREFRAEQDWMIHHFCDPVWRRFVMSGVDAGLAGFPSPLQLLTNYERFTACEWQAPGWEWVDPKNEAAAAHQALEDNTTTLRDELSKRGNRDWREHMKQRAEEKAYQQELNEKFGLQTQEANEEETTETETDEGSDTDAVPVGDDSAGRD